MRAVICGYQRKMGTFTPKDGVTPKAYNNIIIYCMYKKRGVNGNAATSLKFKMDDWLSELKAAGMDDIEPIGMQVDLDYDNEGNFNGLYLPGSEEPFALDLVSDDE